MTSTVRYRVGTYSGSVTVTGVDPDEETDTVIARAKRIVASRSGSLPFGSESWRETERFEEEETP